MAVSKKPGRRKKPWKSDNYELVPISAKHPNGKRRRCRFFATKAEADIEDEKFHSEHRDGHRPNLDPDITLKDYAEHWLKTVRPILAERTLDSYADTLRLHILPSFGTCKLREIGRGAFKALLAEKLGEVIVRKTSQRQRKRGSVRIMYATLRALARSAVDDGIFTENPFREIGRTLKLSPTTKARQNAIKKKAMTRSQLRRFLDAAAGKLLDSQHKEFENVPRLDALQKMAKRSPLLAILFLVMARTGLRIGEALALKPADVDQDERIIHVERTLSDDGKHVGPPKSPSSVRDVHLSQQAADALRRHEVERSKDKLAHGWKHVPLWLFYADSAGDVGAEDYEGPEDDKKWREVRGVLDPHNVRRAFRKVAQALHEADRAAGKPREDCFPLHFTPHSLRHSFASIHISEGKSIEWVQKQLGHEDYTLTVNTYGSWLPSRDATGNDSLDEPDSEAVTNQG